MQTASGNYVSAIGGGGLGGPDTGPTAVTLHTDASAAGPWETFTVIWLDSTYTKFALRTSGGRYVTAVQGGGIGGPDDKSSPIHTDATGIAEWERLTFTFLPRNRVTIKVPDGRFLTAVNGGGMKGIDGAPMRTDAVTRGAWEVFTLITLSAAVDASVAPVPQPVSKPDLVELPAAQGGWLVILARHGGLANRYSRYSINSLGEGATSTQGGNVRRTIPSNLLANVERQIRAAQTQAWVSVTTDCNDCGRTTLDISLRQADGSVTTHTVDWTISPPSFPGNALALVDAIETALPSVPVAR